MSSLSTLLQKVRLWLQAHLESLCFALLCIFTVSMDQKKARAGTFDPPKQPMSFFFFFSLYPSFHDEETVSNIQYLFPGVLGFFTLLLLSLEMEAPAIL